ncbi:uncharacterized protein BO97DRAFT_468901 [Aspergillus homomorphus CBS 101889]|uniref:Leucine-rich repeat domain-containing protein n=1 Tax=Aspergillus homomorphus (strain CBS 101889) TaxID=1450537 RepID=A0A395I6C6_ASPHC|nr:hypothetical protein BO97DRAFT_468901 [Aspergillus homomorphus CBS 101889]RAL14993.1 hypothetical protein BO97DRAFT_468901 [Aspergillus homomorphus CBS 101889]
MDLPLPNDILLLVGEFVEDHWDRYNLLLVSHRFHDLFLHLLYRAATLKSCAQIQSFLGALLHRPELARAVRAVDFHDWQQSRAASASYPFAVTDSTHFINLAETLSQTEEEQKRWVQDLSNGVAEAWFALLLPLIGNLRHLQLAYSKNNNYLDRMMQRAVKGENPFHVQPAFRMLQSVSLSHLPDDEDSRGSFTPLQVLPFFQLPSMRTFSADSVLESMQLEESESQLTETVSSSPITEITLRTSSGSRGMVSLIAACSSLKSFKYQHSDSHLLAEGYRPSSFYRSLDASKGCLQSLWLDNCGTHLPFTIAGANETHDEWFGPLTEFTALKDLRIRLPNLLDVRYQLDPSCPLMDILPASLNSLYVEGCKENSLGMLVRQLKSVLQKRKTQFSNLKRLDIEGSFHDEEDEEASGYQASDSTNQRFIRPRVYEMAEPLREVCAEAGIDLYLRDRDCLDTMRDYF